MSNYVTTPNTPSAVIERKSKSSRMRLPSNLFHLIVLLFYDLIRGATLSTEYSIYEKTLGSTEQLNLIIRWSHYRERDIFSEMFQYDIKIQCSKVFSTSYTIGEMEIVEPIHNDTYRYKLEHDGLPCNTACNYTIVLSPNSLTVNRIFTTTTFEMAPSFPPDVSQNAYYISEDSKQLGIQWRRKESDILCGHVGICLSTKWERLENEIACSDTSNRGSLDFRINVPQGGNESLALEIQMAYVRNNITGPWSDPPVHKRIHLSTTVPPTGSTPTGTNVDGLSIGITAASLTLVLILLTSLTVIVSAVIYTCNRHRRRTVAILQDFSQIASHLTPDDISTVNQDEKTNYTGSSVDLLEKQNIFTKNSLLVLDV